MDNFEQSRTIIQKIVNDVVMDGVGTLFSKALIEHYLCVGKHLAASIGVTELPTVDQSNMDRVEDSLCDCISAFTGYTELGDDLFTGKLYYPFIMAALSLDILPDHIIERHVKQEEEARKKITPEAREKNKMDLEGYRAIRKKMKRGEGGV